MPEPVTFPWTFNCGILGAPDLLKWRRIENADLPELEEEQEILVIWSGGSGPHLYRVHKQQDQWGNTWIYPVPKYGDEWEKPSAAVAYMNRIGAIGEYPFTQVYVRREE